jgi:hypothetical protein
MDEQLSQTFTESFMLWKNDHLDNLRQIRVSLERLNNMYSQIYDIRTDKVAEGFP